MKTLACLVLAGACALGMQTPAGQPRHHDDPAVAAYEHLATAIIAIRATEQSLVRGILMRHYQAALRHLEKAEAASGRDRTKQLERAAAEITNLAAEGSKPIQAIRQRLLQAGHHHHTDAETQEDYIFIDGKERKRLLDLAGHVSRLTGSNAEIERAAADLGELLERAMDAE